MVIFNMKRIYSQIFLIWIINFVIVPAQDVRPVSLKFKQTETMYVRVGDQLNVTCEVNQHLSFLMNHDVDIVIKSAEGEVILTQGLRRIGPEPNYYHVEIDLVPADEMKIHFLLSKVTDQFDGTLICRAKTQYDRGRKVLAEDDLDIVILRPLDALRLHFDDAEPITKSMTDPVEVKSGYHSVACVAEGSNPAATVKLYLDGKEVPGVETKSEKMRTHLTKFRTTLSASVQIWGVQHKLECIAQTQFGDNSSVQLPFKMKTYNPYISCTGSEAYEGQNDVVVSCTVDYTDLDITSFRYSLGGKEYNSEGAHNDEFVQVSKEELLSTKVRVHLKLKIAKDWHFQTEFYMMVVHRNGCIYRESVRLREISNNCAVVRESSITLLMLLAVWWLVQHGLMKQSASLVWQPILIDKVRNVRIHGSTRFPPRKAVWRCWEH